jgi:glycosyltransferase involved in cell wall biosynthesis
MINEAARMARGEWVILMDADILLPPRALSRIQTLGPEVQFTAPDGRKMLDPDTTARILMGEFRPWESWDALVEAPVEYRYREAHGVPIGFFQAVRRSCFDKVQYVEFNHFEGSDFFFGNDIIEEFGPVHRLDGMPVLHMDHGGSQWYGTPRHR